MSCRGRSATAWRDSLRWLGDSPVAILGFACLALAFPAAGRVAAALQAAASLRQAEAMLVAELAADAAVMKVGTAAAAGDEVMELGGVRVEVARTRDGFRVRTRQPGLPDREFLAVQLPGGAPGAFGQPIASRNLADAGGLPWPRLDGEALASAGRAEQLPMFRLDPGVAFLQWAAGTDLADYVAVDDAAVGSADWPCQLVVVPGHLWILPGEAPWRPRLDRDVTVVVQGNLYLGRSVVPVGAGRLQFAIAAPDGKPCFADLDGDGRRSGGDLGSSRPAQHAPIEGAGNVYAGSLQGSAQRLQLEAGLWLDGVVHLHSDLEVAGPLLLGAGMVALNPGRQLVPAGRFQYDAARECVPGFLVEGPPRPGRLRRVTADSAADHQDLLYLAAPGR
jgi:hypothetical protein